PAAPAKPPPPPDPPSSNPLLAPHGRPPEKKCRAHEMSMTSSFQSSTQYSSPHARLRSRPAAPPASAAHYPAAQNTARVLTWPQSLFACSPPPDRSPPQTPF